MTHYPGELFDGVECDGVEWVRLNDHPESSWTGRSSRREQSGGEAAAILAIRPIPSTGVLANQRGNRTQWRWQQRITDYDPVRIAVISRIRLFL